MTFLNSASKLFLLAAAFFVIATVSGCDFDAAKSAIDNLDVIITLPEVQTTAVGQITDAASGNLVKSEVNVSFAGPNANLVVNDFEDAIANASTTHGFVRFGLKNGIVPSSNSPVNVQMLVNAAGYEPTSTTVVFTDLGKHNFEIALTSPNALPSGASAGSASTASTAAIVVQTPVTASTGSVASLQVPAGSEFMTQDGKAVRGTIETRVSYYSPASPASLRSFPGGFSSATVQQGGTSGTRSLMTAGFASVKMTSGSQVVHSFGSGSVNKEIQIPSGTINPKTNRPYTSGDRLNIYSYDKATGDWQFQQEVAVEEAAGKLDGGMTVRYPSRLASMDAAAQAFEECSVGATVNIERNGHVGTLHGFRSGPDGGQLYKEVEIAAGTSSFRFQGAPQGAAGTFSLRTPDSDEPISIEVADFCAGSYTISLPAPVRQPETVRFSIDLPCTLKFTKDNESKFDLKYRPQGSATASWLSLPKPTWEVDALNRIKGGAVDVAGLYRGTTYDIILVYPDGDETGTVQTSMKIESLNESYSFDNGTDGDPDNDIPNDYCIR